MNEDPTAAPPPADRGNEVDAGEPVPELARLVEDPSPRLLSNVIDGISRRQALTHAIEISWWGVTSMLLEFVQTILQALGAGRDKPREG